jgi:transcriptional regulator with XRE-family HTH domain
MNTEKENKVGERIKELRKKNRISQIELAEKLNCKSSTISVIESGKNNVTSEMVVEMSKIFNVSTDYILTGIENKTITITEQEIIQLVRKNDDIKETLLKILDTKKKAIQRMMMQAQNYELMAA